LNEKNTIAREVLRAGDLIIDASRGCVNQVKGGAVGQSASGERRPINDGKSAAHLIKGAPTNQDYRRRETGRVTHKRTFDKKKLSRGQGGGKEIGVLGGEISFLKEDLGKGSDVTYFLGLTDPGER